GSETYGSGEHDLYDLTSHVSPDPPLRYGSSRRERIWQLPSRGLRRALLALPLRLCQKAAWPWLMLWGSPTPESLVIFCVPDYACGKSPGSLRTALFEMLR